MTTFTTTVQDIIDALKKLDPKLPVLIGNSSGDYWRSILADDIEDLPETRLVRYSNYHNTYKQPDREHLTGEEVEVVVIGTLNWDQ